MTIKKMMMAAGAVDGPQVIAPSSNDFDYTFAASEWPVAGNTLGDHTIGGFTDSIGGDSGLSCLHTFDGDFEVTCTITAMDTDNTLAMGFHEIAEDSKRSVSDVLGMFASSTKSFFWSAGSKAGGGTQDRFWYGNAQDDSGSHAYAAGDVVKITRESGVFKWYDSATLVHTFAATSSNPVRFFLGAGGGAGQDIDNILFTDTEKVQRDGQFDEAPTNGSVGDGIGSRKHSGLLFKATRTGTITSNMVEVISVNTGANFHCEVWSHDGTNPGSQLGSDSTTVSLGTTGKKTFVFTDPAIVKGTYYWMILVDESTSGHVALTQHLAHPSGMGAGMNDTLTSIYDNWAEGTAMEITYTATGEPTPDHDTLLLIHSNTSDGSTTFADSSQSGRTITVAGNAQHDTAQKPFGASSILFDGTGDYLTVPDSNDWAFSNAFTIDFWMRAAGVGVNQPLIGQWSSGSNSGIAWYLFRHSSNVIEFTFGNGSSSTSAVSTSTIAATTWYHIACVYDGGKMGLWHNGTSQTTTSSTIVTNNLGLVVDIGRDFAGRYFNGHLHEIRISNVARWEPGVNFTPPTSAYP